MMIFLVTLCAALAFFTAIGTYLCFTRQDYDWYDFIEHSIYAAFLVTMIGVLLSGDMLVAISLGLSYLLTMAIMRPIFQRFFSHQIYDPFA